jgi:electron transfer flavoprotein beta subunit
MNILVCISKVPDTTSKIGFNASGDAFDSTGVNWIVNPSDEWYALVRALELKEAHGGTVTIVTVGGTEDESVMRKALAIGADEAVRIDVTANDAQQVAEEISSYAKGKGFDFILTGKETIDYNGGVLGGLMAAHLDVPYIPFIEFLDFQGGKAMIRRDIGGGVEVLEVDGCFVASASKGLAEQRLPNMRGIMAARTKPIQVLPSCGAQVRVRAVKFTLPPSKSAVKLVAPDEMDELVRLLHEEAKAL